MQLSHASSVAHAAPARTTAGRAGSTTAPAPAPTSRPGPSDQGDTVNIQSTRGDRTPVRAPLKTRVQVVPDPAPGRPDVAPPEAPVSRAPSDLGAGQTLVDNPAPPEAPVSSAPSELGVERPAPPSEPDRPFRAIRYFIQSFAQRGHDGPDGRHPFLAGLDHTGERFDKTA